MNFNPIKDWFYFSRAQRRGIVVFLVIIVAVPVLTEFWKQLQGGSALDHEAFLAEVRLFEEHLRLAEEALALESEMRAGGSPAGSRSLPQRIELRPFAFDPNNMTQAAWDSLGMPGRISRSINNFLAAGGGFRYKEDFRRIYLLEDWMYDELESYIDLPARPAESTVAASRGHRQASAPADERSPDMASGGSGGGPKSVAGTAAITSRPLLVNINTADSIELQKIRGIGPAFSRRIAGYRALLGGFISTEQLMEVYGLDSTRFDAIREFVTTDSTVFAKIDLNTAEFGDLVRHPYIDRQTAGAILNLRRQHGPFQDVKDVQKSYLITDSVFERLTPYLSLEKSSTIKSTLKK